MGTYSAGPYKKAKNHKPPALPGKERYTDKKTGEDVYDGTTNNLRDRIARQKRDGMPYTSDRYEASFKVADHRSTDKTRKQDEVKTIARKDGKFNQDKGGGGRLPKNSGRRSK
jgi:hypothetical protein